jgi:hypothetical protein
MRKPHHLPHRQSRIYAQQGHALTEFIVVAVALVPLFLLMPLIGKYQDIAHSTLAASRYVAFDQLTRYQNPKPQAQLEQEVQRRFFSATALPIKSNDAAGNVQADQNPLWRDPTNRPLIAKFSDIQVSPSWTAQTGSPDALNQSANKLVNLPERDIYTATIKVPLINLPEGLRFYEPFDKLNLQVKRHTSVVADPWSASSPAAVQAQIDRPLLVPLSTPLRALDPFVDTWMDVVERRVTKPNLGRLDFWVDQVPPDRLPAP